MHACASKDVRGVVGIEGSILEVYRGGGKMVDDVEGIP